MAQRQTGNSQLDIVNGQRDSAIATIYYPLKKAEAETDTHTVGQVRIHEKNGVLAL